MKQIKRYDIEEIKRTKKKAHFELVLESDTNILESKIQSLKKENEELRKYKAAWEKLNNKIDNINSNLSDKLKYTLTKKLVRNIEKELGI